MRKRQLAAFFFLGFVTQSQACLDPSTPVFLKGSSYEEMDISVSSGGISFGQLLDKDSFSVGYSLTEQGWKGGAKGGLLSSQHKLRSKSGKIIGLLVPDHKNRTLKLLSVKRPFDELNFEVDDSKAEIVFKSNSDEDTSALETKAIDRNGTVLGTVRSQHSRFAKAAGSRSVNDRVDLGNAETSVVDCGGKKSEPSESFSSGSRASGQRIPPAAKNPRIRFKD